MNSLTHKLAIALLFLFAVACSADSGELVIGGDECQTDDDCESGTCDDGECVGWDITEECSHDDDCDIGRCVETADGSVCPDTCGDDDDCQSDEECEPGDSPEDGFSCQPTDPTDPTDPEEQETTTGSTSTLCAAGGIAERDGLRLYHCFSPYDTASPTLSNDQIRLHSGGFSLSSDY